MIKTQKVSFAALRILTYTILAKAVFGLVMLISRVRLSNTLATLARTATIITIVACVLCLVGITALSKQFVYTFRIMVAVLLLDSFSMLSAVFELYLSAAGHPAMAVVADYMALASHSASRLMTGAAFLYLMRAFGDLIENDGDRGEAGSAEKLGMLYCVCTAACVAFAALNLMSDINAIALVSAIFELSMIVLELLMYRITAKAAYECWIKSTAAVPYM